MSSKTGSNYVLCIENRDCDDLIKGKVYRIVSDPKAAEEAYLRVIDESGEDYLYPESYFTQVEIPQEVEEALAAG